MTCTLLIILSHGTMEHVAVSVWYMHLNSWTFSQTKEPLSVQFKCIFYFNLIRKTFQPLLYVTILGLRRKCSFISLNSVIPSEKNQQSSKKKKLFSCAKRFKTYDTCINMFCQVTQTRNMFSSKPDVLIRIYIYVDWPIFDINVFRSCGYYSVMS